MGKRLCVSRIFDAPQMGMISLDESMLAWNQCDDRASSSTAVSSDDLSEFARLHPQVEVPLK